MKSIIRKFLSLSLAVVLAAAPLNAFASDALGDDLTSSNVEVNERTKLNAGTFWSNTYSDLRQENYVVYEPNRSVKPIVSSGSYSTQLSTVSAAARTLEADGYRVVAGINGDYYDTANGIALGSVMSEGVFRNISGSYYALGFYDDGTAVMGKPNLRINAETDRGSTFGITAMNYVRQTSFGIFLYDDSFNARGTIGTSEPGLDVICSVDRGELGIGEELTLRVENIVESGVDTAVGKGQYVLSVNLKSSESYLASMRALQVGDRVTVSVSVPNLMIGFGIDEVQADYVAEIKLRHLNREYILKRTGEIEQLEADIADLNDILAKPARIRKIIMKELADVAKKYGQPRRSEILYDLPEEEGVLPE